MKALHLIIRVIGLFGAAAIVLWLLERQADIARQLPAGAGTEALDQILYFTTVPLGTLAFLLILPYSLLPRLARRICLLLMLLLASYYLLYRFGAHFFTPPYPYSKPEPLTAAAGLALLSWIAFFLAQFFSIYNTHSDIPPPGSDSPTKKS